jgi:hypothetical protein
VNDDLVDELREISEERERRESELADLRQELERKDARIQELKRELEEAKDLKRMADRFSQALLRRADAPYREHVETTSPDEQSTLDEVPPDKVVDVAGEGEADATEPDGEAAAAASPSPYPGYDESGADGADEDGDASSSDDEAGEVATDSADAEASVAEPDAAEEAVARVVGSGNGHAEASIDRGEASNGHAGAAGGGAADAASSHGRGSTVDGPGPSAPSSGPSGDRPGGAGDASTWGRGLGVDASSADAPGDRPAFEPDRHLGSREAVVEAFHERVASFDGVTRRMLATLRDEGPMDPVSAHVAAGGDGDRRRAYSRLRRLRRAEFVEHDGGGRYAYVLPDLIRDAYADRLSEAELRAAVANVEDAI